MNIGRVYPKRVGPTTLTTSAVLQFTADKRYSVERWSFTNYGATTATVTLHIVTSEDSVASSNKIVGGLSILANDVTTLPLPIILENGDTVYALSDTATSVNLTFNVNDVEVGIL